MRIRRGEEERKTARTMGKGARHVLARTIFEATNESRQRGRGTMPNTVEIEIRIEMIGKESGSRSATRSSERAGAGATVKLRASATI
eukprot:6208108-Pleurochrysis_carterae.AAC.3